MTRLTKDLRQTIATSATDHGFASRLEALRQEADVLARAAYFTVIDKREYDQAAAMPSNWFRLDRCLKFNVGGYTLRLSLQDEGLPVPYHAKGEERGGWGCGSLGVIHPGDLCDRIQAHARAQEEYKDQRCKAYRSVMTLLESVSTIKRLGEVWPEGAEFYSRYAETSSASLPAIRVDEINAVLGLTK